MEKQKQLLEYNLYQIPQYAGQIINKHKQIVVGLIDASGSMSSYWVQMVKFWNKTIAPQTQFLITFSQNAKLQEDPVLSENLHKHGGGMTNIYAAFETLEKRLTQVNQNSFITVVFISDGQDTVHGVDKIAKKLVSLKGGQGRYINFICLGIQSGFPTTLAMKLRQLYHTGDQTIPAVYLIEYASQKAFFNKFETMANCFKAAKGIQIPTAGNFIKQYPWQKPGQTKFKQGKWVMVHKQFPKLQIIYDGTVKNSFEVTDISKLTIDNLVDCFRGWVQKIQLLSMDNNKIAQTQKIAEYTAQLMKSYVTEFQDVFHIEIINMKMGQGKDSFKHRATSLAVKNTGSRIKWFIDQLLIIAKGVGIGQLNEYEAAKRIGIGTITGKYHQKALALKGITVKDFTLIKQEFAEVYKKTKLRPQPSKQQVSIFTLQNQKQVFQEPDFLEGLDYCKSQFDLVETFPVVGYGLKAKRHDGSMINPWKVRVQQLAKTHKTIDSMYLAKNNNKYQLSVGNDQTQQINAVLPLFDLEDLQMSPLLNTRLFKLAVSFMVVQNIDTYHQQAYMALLGSTFIFLLKQQQSQWRDNLITQIYSSLKITYGQTQSFKLFIKQVQQNPYNLFIAKQKQDHVDIIKVFLIIFYISRQNRLSQDKINHLVDLALVHYAQKTYVQNQFKIFRVVDVKIKEDQSFIKQDKQNQIKQINKIKDHDHLHQIVEGQVKDIMNMAAIQLKINDKIFTHQDLDKRVCFSHIQKFFEMFRKRKLDKEQILYYFGHYIKGKNSQNYNSPVIKDIKQLQKNLMVKVDLKQIGKGQAKQMKKIKKVIQDKFLENFRKTHFGIVPMNKQTIIKICQEKKFNPNVYDINPNNNLIRNTCMSPLCEFFMVPMTNKQITQHLRLWRHKIPPRFHLTVVNRLKQHKKPQQICDEIIKSGLVNIKKHEKGKQFVLDYIINIAKSL